MSLSARLNLSDAEMQLGGRTAPRFYRDMRLKEWEHFGFIHDDYYFGVVIFDAKFMAVSFFYAFNRKTGEFFEHSRTGVGNPVRVARELMHGECYYRHLGYRMEFENRLDNGVHRITAEIKQSRGKPSIKADLRLLEDLDRFEPLVVVSPVGLNRGLYTHKAACPAEGVVEIGGKKVVLDPAKHVGLMDVQKTHYPFDTFWKWSTFAGYDEDGRLIAMNVCQNFIEDDERYNENCTWVDGKLTPMSAARFTYDENDLMAPWNVAHHRRRARRGVQARGREGGKDKPRPHHVRLPPALRRVRGRDERTRWRNGARRRAVRRLRAPPRAFLDGGGAGADSI